MLKLLSSIIPVYVQYKTESGNNAVRARTWHPSWFIPVLSMGLRYQLDLLKRYKAYQVALAQINQSIHSDKLGQKSKVIAVTRIIEELECGYDCEFVEPYGFVPGAGCPIHDRH